MADNYYNHRVRLVSVRNENRRVEFKVTPTFTEGRSVDYTPITPIHMPGSIQVYKNSASRVFNIGAKLISRNVNEANDNMITLQQLRTWTLPHFGIRSSTLSSGQQASRARIDAAPSVERERFRQNPLEDELGWEEQDQLARDRVNTGNELLGAPPMVLYLYAYSPALNDERGVTSSLRVNINRVPVVITNLSLTYPNDVDYFPAAVGLDGVTTSTESFPTKMDVTVDCVETHSPREYEQFSLGDFYNGKLVSF